MKHLDGIPTRVVQCIVYVELQVVVHGVNVVDPQRVDIVFSQPPIKLVSPKTQSWVLRKLNAPNVAKVQPKLGVIYQGSSWLCKHHQERATKRCEADSANSIHSAQANPFQCTLTYIRLPPKQEL